MLTCYAHSLEGRLPNEWEPLADHLQRVAELAAEFAKKFEAAEWGRIAGLWHDLGKYSEEFQAYLFKENGLEAHLEQYKGRVDHSTAGAKRANDSLGESGRLLAYCIAGHHAGLPDAFGDRSALEARLKKKIPAIDAVPQELFDVNPLHPPPLSIDLQNQQHAAFQVSFFVRMLFSSLVDADFLSTEEFMSKEKARLRPKSSATIGEMLEQLDLFLLRLQAKATPGDVTNCRNEVLDACRMSAEQEPGLFSLTVPTGGGKTFSSLAFALQHAQRHGMERVIYATPFTSIIEQTGNNFRDVFHKLDEGTVLEHHSNFDPNQETQQSRLACENWDAPLVVTTNVQLFESLFSSRTSACRKLHRLVRSVLILDEAQTLPVDYVAPCLAALRELVCNYGCSVVLCTATQPALSYGTRSQSVSILFVK